MRKISKKSYEIRNFLPDEEKKKFSEILTNNQVDYLEICDFDEGIKFLKDNSTLKTLKLFISQFNFQISEIIASIIKKNVLTSLSLRIRYGNNNPQEIYTALKSNTSITDLCLIGVSLDSEYYKTFKDFLTNTPNLSKLSFSMDKFDVTHLFNPTFSTLKSPISLKHLEITYGVFHDELIVDCFKHLVNLERIELDCPVNLQEFTKKVTFKTHPNLKFISLIPKEIDSELDFQNSTFTHITLLNSRESFGLKSLYYFMKGLVEYKNIKYLCIQNMESIEEEEKEWIHCLKELLIKSNHLEVLDISETCLNVLDSLILYEGFKQNDFLKTLKLCSKNYEETFEDLGKVLQPKKNLEYLKLLIPFRFEYYFNVFMTHFQHNNSLKKFKLNCDLDETGRELFLNFLLQNQSLEYLELDDFDTNDDFLIKLSETLSKKNLKIFKLSLSYNFSFTGKSFEYLSKNILKMSNLEKLSLELSINASIVSEEHHQVLFECITQNKQIKDLTIRCNYRLEKKKIDQNLYDTLFYNYNLRNINIDPLTDYGKMIQARNLDFISNYYNFRDSYQNLFFYFK